MDACVSRVRVALTSTTYVSLHFAHAKLACVTRPHECPSGLYSITSICAIMFCAAAVPCTHACSSKPISNLRTAYTISSTMRCALAAYAVDGMLHRLGLTVPEMRCQQACFILPNVRGWPDRRGRVPAADFSRIAVQQHPARLIIPGSFDGNLAGGELSCTYDGRGPVIANPCLIFTPNRIQFCTRKTLCAHTHIR